MDSNRGPLVFEVPAIPMEPQPLHEKCFYFYSDIGVKEARRAGEGIKAGGYKVRKYFKPFKFWSLRLLHLPWQIALGRRQSFLFDEL